MLVDSRCLKYYSSYWSHVNDLLAKTSITRHHLLSTLKSLGYTTFELLLTPLQFGIPNSRLRYYLLAKMGPLNFQTVHKGPVWRHIPGFGEDWVDPRSLNDPDADLTVGVISRYLDEEVYSKQSHPNSVPDRVLEKWGRLFDIVFPSSRRSCCFTRGLVCP